MSFIWAPALLFLALIPLGVWVYRSREGRRAARVAQFGWGSAGGVGPSPVARRRGAIRRFPAVCTVAGLSILVLSIARPQSVIGVPRLEGTIVLAFDVSGSMAATDVAPTRIEAAKAAALAFVGKEPPSVRIGIVVFSDSGFSTQVPTYDRLAVETGIQRLKPERGTSLGSGILESLAAIATADDPSTTDYYTNRSPAPTVAPTPVPEGVFEPTIIVLLTDGENTGGGEPLAAAQAARDRGVRIDTVGIGSPGGATIEVDGFRIHTQLDEAALRAISDTSGGTYYAAADQGDLSAIYADVGSRLVVRTEPFELTPILAVLGFAFLFAGGVTSLRWFGRMP